MTKGGRCIGCKHFIFDTQKGHYMLDEDSGWGECTHPEASKKHPSISLTSRCDHFERKT